MNNRKTDNMMKDTQTDGKQLEKKARMLRFCGLFFQIFTFAAFALQIYLTFVRPTGANEPIVGMIIMVTTMGWIAFFIFADIYQELSRLSEGPKN